MWSTPAPPLTAFVASSIWSGVGDVNTSPGQAASSIPSPTKPPCIGSCPEPPPETRPTLPCTGASARTITFGSYWTRKRSAWAAAMPCRASVTTSSGLLISFFTFPPLLSSLSFARLRQVLHGLALDLDVGGRRLTAGHQPLVDEEVVNQRAYHRPHNWSDDWEPPVPVDVAVVPRQRHSVPAGEPGEEPRPEIAGRVDRVTRIRAEGYSDPGDDQADEPRTQVPFRCQVPLVDDGEHNPDEERGPDQLVDEGPDRVVEVAGREGGEDAVRGDRTRLPAHRVGGTFVALDRVLVVEVDERGGGECACDLGEDVVRHLRPREPALY